MKLPFAVYTATEGYGWAAGRSHDRATLERMRRAVGKTPDFDYGAPGCCGAVNEGDTVAVYRFMRAEKWDSKGRNAAYLALSFFPRSQARDIDFARLLELEPFRVPIREPPEWIDCPENASGVVSCDPETACAAGSVLEIACAGAVFARPFPGTLRVNCEEGPAAGRCLATYKQAACETGAPLAEHAKAKEVVLAGHGAPAPRRRHETLKEAVAIAAGLALFAGAVCWRVCRHDARNAPAERVCAHAENVRETALPEVFDDFGRWLGLCGFFPWPVTGDVTMVEGDRHE